MVLRSPAPSRETAFATAQALLAAVTKTHDEGGFAEAAKSSARGAARVVAERLAPFDVSGRASSGAQFDAAFVTAALALHTPGEMSGLVESPFGWHVIRLLARTPPPAAELETVRAENAEAVVASRVRARIRDILAKRRQQTNVEVSGARRHADGPPRRPMTRRRARAPATRA